MALATYLTMTTIGVLTKVWAFTVLRKNWQKKKIHYLTFFFLCTLLLQSFFEIYGYYFSYTKNSAAASIGMIGYYICTYIFISTLPFISLLLTRISVNTNIIRSAILVQVVVVGLLLFSDLIIAGAKPLGITFTAIKGDLYWLFQFTVIASIGITIYLLKRISFEKDYFLAMRANNILLSFVPFALFAVFLIFAMQVGVKINAIGFLPILISIFAAAITSNICKREIVDYRYWVPFSKKRREINKLIKPFIEVQADGLDPELKKKYNKLITQHALELFNGNQTKAAEWLKVSQSWVSRNNKNLNE